MKRLVLAMVLAATVALAGWWAWRSLAPGAVFVDEAAAFLLDDLGRARTALEQAAATTDPGRRGEAMARAEGALVSAWTVSDHLAQSLRPRGYRLADPYTLIHTQTLDILQYCRELSPDMLPAELQRRIELLGGLEKALAAGLESDWRGGPAPRVNRRQLVQSWRDYLVSLNPPVPGGPTRLALPLGDPPIAAHVRAAAAGSDLTVTIDWDRTRTVFPLTPNQTLLLYGSGPLSLTGWESTAANQDGLGRAGAYPPAAPWADSQGMLDAFRGQLPAHWTEPDHLVAVHVLEGLPQTVTLHLSGPAADVEVLYLQHRGWMHMKAERVQ